MEAAPYVSLDPSGVAARAKEARQRAPRLDSLDGGTIGLLANGKTNSEELLECVYDELRQRFDLAGVLRHRKGSVSIPPDPTEFDRFLSEATFVVTATGD